MAAAIRRTKMADMGLIAEFKTFIVKGNAIDLAVGIIIGAAFGALVKSLVDDVMMPPIGYLVGGVDFADKSIQLAPAVAKGATHPIFQTVASKDIPAVVISYGKFINSLIQLIIQGFCVFLLVKAINKLKRKEAVAPSTPPAPTTEEKLLTEIRDLLAQK
jgi:large conductance mechanosensitive channel